jgi:hypothetical protein
MDEASQHVGGVLKVFELDKLDSTLSCDLQTSFEEIASEWKFRRQELGSSPMTVEEICNHNAGAAQSMQLHDVALSWMQLKDIAKEMSTSGATGLRQAGGPV